jgi:hypothetical protein
MNQKKYQQPIDVITADLNAQGATNHNPGTGHARHGLHQMF